MCISIVFYILVPSGTNREANLENHYFSPALVGGMELDNWTVLPGEEQGDGEMTEAS